MHTCDVHTAHFQRVGIRLGGLCSGDYFYVENTRHIHYIKLTT